MSDANWQIFKDVKMYRSLDKTESNLQSLFTLTDGMESDPLPSSLFNIDTLKTLISLGQSTPNIISD